ncbi:acyltransferase family protein [Paenibacillus hodogayensis]|uniref:Acyltransferase family protein n=1 Tax=Paenibacillus hodogayensis TaxID=279208 RepID=A0ABV5VRN6_9BACL
MNPSANKRMIQASRGIAVFLVMLFHAAQTGLHYFDTDFLGISRMGRSGAYTFFFVLTGYLMTAIYGKHRGDVSMFGTFLLKRLARIYPLYILIMAAVVPVFILMPSFGVGFEREPSAIVGSLLLWPQANGPILPVAWSLSYIVMFYLAFSLCFLLKEKVLVAIGSSWITIIALNAAGWIVIKQSAAIQFLFNPIHLEFFVGVAVAVAVKRRKWSHDGWWMAAGTALFVLLWIVRHEWPDFLQVDMAHTVPSALLLLGIVTWRGPQPKLLKPLAAMGDASYSILLVSLPAMSVTFKLARTAHVPDWAGASMTITVCFLLALGLCLLFYRWIERPLNELIRKRFTSGQRAVQPGTKRPFARPNR